MKLRHGFAALLLIVLALVVLSTPVSVQAKKQKVVKKVKPAVSLGNEYDSYRAISDKAVIVTKYGKDDSVLSSVIDSEGNIIQNFNFLGANDEDIEGGLAIFVDEVDGRYKRGVIGSDGKILYEAKYDRFLGGFNNGFAVVYNYDSEGIENYGIIDDKGNEILAPKYSYIYPTFSEGLVPFCQDGKYGYLNKKGKVVIKPQYDQADSFVNGYATVRVYNSDGGTAAVIDKKGNFVIKPGKYDYIGSFNNGIAVVKVCEKQGAIDINGNVVVPIKYYYLNGFYNGTSIAVNYDYDTEEAEFYAVDINGGESKITEYNGIFDPKADGTIIVESYSDDEFCYGLINNDGTLLIPAEYDSITNFDGLIFAKKDSVYYIFDNKGNMVSDFTFDYLVDYGTDTGLAVFCKDELYGAMNSKGEVVIEQKYDNMSYFSDGLALVEKDGKYGYVNVKGKEVVAPQYDVAEEFKGGGAVVGIGTRNEDYEWEEIEYYLIRKK